MKRAWLAAIAATALALPVAALSQGSYPEKPITIVTPYPAGGAADLIARAIGQAGAVALGKPMLVDNRPGGAGTLGGSIVAKAAPDGYTLLMGTDAPLVSGPLLVSPAPYQISAFTPIGRLASIPLVMIVGKDKPFNSVESVVAHAKAHPSVLNFGSAGLGTQNHFMVERLAQEAKIKITHVPYKGGAPAMVDLMSGVVDVYFCQISTCAAAIKDKRVKPLGITSASRSPSLPEVPTMQELGYKTMTADTWFGIVAPVGMPADRVAILERAIKSISQDAGFKAALDKAGADPVDDVSAAGFRSFLQQQRVDMERMLAANPMKLN